MSIQDSVHRAMTKYRGPADGKSHPEHTRAMRAGVKGIVPLMVRVNEQGAENLPAGGPVVYAYDHPSTLEPLINYRSIERDFRSMAMIELFRGPMGKLATWVGGYPVDRKNPQPVSMQHSIDLLQEGIPVAIAPSGSTEFDQNITPPFRLGAANMAVKGGADSVVPITYYYHKADPQDVHPLERTVGRVAAGLLTATTLAAAVAGAPLVAVAGGAAAGAYAGGAVAQKFVHAPFCVERLLKLGARVGGGVVGAAAAAGLTAAAVSAAPVLAIPAALLGGAAVLRLSRAWQRRDVADMVIGQPIPVQPVIDEFGEGEAVPELTRQVHDAIGHVKAELSGVPYDPDVPKIAEGHRHSQQQ